MACGVYKFWRCLFLLIIALGCQIISCPRAYCLDTDESSRPKRISVLGYVTWWSHDAVGYHPAIQLKVENTSGQDLSGTIIRFQARFTDLRNGYVTVARQEKRIDFTYHQQVTLPVLRGPAPFELPIDENEWPTIECKAMSRIGDVGDEGTQDLMVTRLESVTMTDEEALSQLTRQTGLGRTSSVDKREYEMMRRRRRDHADQVATVPDKPMIATAGSLAPALSKAKNHEPEKNAGNQHVPSTLPALGDDFYQFEKCFGVPNASDIVPSKGDLTWVKYPGRGYFNDVFVGSRGSSGKADLIVVTLPCQLKEADLLAVAKLLVGKMRGQNLSPFVHSVRYLPSGRSEIARSTGQDCHIISFKVLPATGNEAKNILAVSRLSGDLEGSLAAYARRLPMMALLLPAVRSDQD